MANASEKSAQDLATLESTVATTTALITQLLSSASNVEKSSASSSDGADIDAISLSHDSASLIRAHSTKISLLIINKPFTASAITTVLRGLVAGPLPGLASAVELCEAAKYTKAMSKELQWRAKNVFSELATLVRTIPLDGKVLTTNQKNGTGNAAGKGSLACAGVVWEACDAVMELKNLGVAGLMIKKAEEYRDLVKDALEELQEWDDEESDGEDGEHEDHADEDDADGINTSAQDALDRMFASQHHIPSADPDKIRPRLMSCQKRLQLILLMFQAVVKRRFKTLPPVPSVKVTAPAKGVEGGGIVSCLNEVLDVFRKIPDIADELASSFYELDSAEIDKRMDECFFAGFAVAELLVRNWEDEQDEFTVWARKFQVAMKTPVK
ncbi:hypothetical protein BJ875DRAFT_386164 [Amylocarpus encephaloides]|uniref:Cyclin-D1-binding protein 1-like N-terminal domain-containing protein n=1 Tax=Amylocarpus encephaloides TaxID=45428 RepID=A0A9P7YAR7_9HELO|nr:hypothetical protein BJ875DRAFT_386164 [Amylocarpus encephaloides]